MAGYCKKSGRAIKLILVHRGSVVHDATAVHVYVQVGQVPVVQSAVYEEFARTIPGFKPLSDTEAATIAPKVFVLITSWKIIDL